MVQVLNVSKHFPEQTSYDDERHRPRYPDEGRARVRQGLYGDYGNRPEGCREAGTRDYDDDYGDDGQRRSPRSGDANAIALTGGRDDRGTGPYNPYPRRGNDSPTNGPRRGGSWRDEEAYRRSAQRSRDGGQSRQSRGNGGQTGHTSRDYGSGRSDDQAYDYEDEDRGFLEQAGDEVRSWFGDEDAERRRKHDHRGRGPKGYQRSDDRIEVDVNDQLTDDFRFDASDISVTVEDGEVTLDGYVVSRSAKRCAADCVESVSGVKHVQNNLRGRDRDETGEASTSTASTSSNTASVNVMNA